MLAVRMRNSSHASISIKMDRGALETRMSREVPMVSFAFRAFMMGTVIFLAIGVKVSFGVAREE